MPLSSDIHPPFCLRDIDDYQRVSEFISDWTLEQVSELGDYLGLREMWFVSTAQDTPTDTLMTADEVFGLVLEGRAAKEKKAQSDLERKLAQYHRLQKELGL